MKNKISKLIINTLIISNVFTMLPASAKSQYYNSTESVKYENSENVNVTSVYATLASSFNIIIPKTIIIDGITRTGEYKIKAEGDIAGTESIEIKPDESFVLSEVQKNTDAIVEQEKILWDINEIKAGNETTGIIKAPNLSAGIWSGTFNFNIKTIDSLISVESNTIENIEAYKFTDEEEAELKMSLQESGLIESDDITLVNIDANHFEGENNVKIKVSNIAQNGEYINVLHFDEKNQEWELFDSYEVIDGYIETSFKSFSPVALVKEDAGYTVTWKKPIAYPASGRGIDGAYSGREAASCYTYYAGETTATIAYSECNYHEKYDCDYIGGARYGNKRIKYTKPNGKTAYANPYKIGKITIKKETPIFVEMFSGKGSSGYYIRIDEEKAGLEKRNGRGNLISYEYLPKGSTEIKLVLDYAGAYSTYFIYQWCIKMIYLK